MSIPVQNTDKREKCVFLKLSYDLVECALILPRTRLDVIISVNIL